MLWNLLGVNNVYLVVVWHPAGCYTADYRFSLATFKENLSSMFNVANTKRFLIVVVLLMSLVISTGSTLAAPPEQESRQRTITVTGYGVAYGAPDIARVGLGVARPEISRATCCHEHRDESTLGGRGSRVESPRPDHGGSVSGAAAGRGNSCRGGVHSGLCQYLCA